MKYRLTRLIGEKARENGWNEINQENRLGLENGLEIIEVEINRGKIRIKIKGEGSVLIKRNNLVARLKDGSTGQIKESDEIWILDKKAGEEYKLGERENFEGAAIKLEMTNNKKDIFIKEKNRSLQKSHKSINLILGLVVLGLLIAGTFFGYHKRIQNENKNKIETAKEEINKIETEIESVRSINIDTALELAQKAELIISQIKVTDKKQIDEVEAMKTKIEEIKKSLGAESIDYEVAYDTNLIVEGGKFKGMTIRGDLAYLWSSELGQINRVDIKNQSTEKVVSDERIKLWLGIFNNGDGRYGFDQNKIYEIKINSLIETEIKEIKNIGDIGGWNGLFYVLNNDNQKIEKLSNKNGIVWLKEGVSLMEETTGMAIDGDIWVLGKSGRIYHYSRGEEKKYEMSFVPSLTTSRALETNAEVDFLAYIADNNTVYIYHKDGRILGKNYFGKTIINDIAIDNQNRDVLVLAADGKIYRIKIE
ncbi:MAG TPA: hypothetical protein PLU63_03080 [Candidatus Woesebacteria bacterium]|nr:hypothetical protein [Candidatus Woesebacteria bacterium]